MSAYKRLTNTRNSYSLTAMLLPTYGTLIFGILLNTIAPYVGAEAKTCTLRPLGSGKDDTDQVREPLQLRQ